MFVYGIKINNFVYTFTFLINFSKTLLSFTNNYFYINKKKLTLKKFHNLNIKKHLKLTTNKELQYLLARLLVIECYSYYIELLEVKIKSLLSLREKNNINNIFLFFSKVQF